MDAPKKGSYLVSHPGTGIIQDNFVQLEMLTQWYPEWVAESFSFGAGFMQDIYQNTVLIQLQYNDKWQITPPVSLEFVLTTYDYPQTVKLSD